MTPVTPPAPVAQNNPTPAPGKPTVLDFAVEPTTVERGQSALLRWSVSNATEVTIDNGVGTVQSNGSRKIIPSESTTYKLTARGSMGEVTATATVNVTGAAPPPPPAAATGTGTLESRLGSQVQDAYFDYDSSSIREDARTALTKDADALKGIFNDFPNATIVIEGHGDERGSAEYNLGLGDRRASAAKEFLTLLGVPADKLKTISYGKERPQCTEATESCYQLNRRAHVTTGQ
ncbi:MAG: OmpA family protein [Acidobacteriota bacterium]|nr:OmpA family protein [Acidobacteriota bacterium]